jgi:hypothetical protein
VFSVSEDSYVSESDSPNVAETRVYRRPPVGDQGMRFGACTLYGGQFSNKSISVSVGYLTRVRQQTTEIGADPQSACVQPYRI